MKACFYLYLRSFRNRFKKALHKPLTYFLLAIVLLYIFMIPYYLNILVKNWGINNPRGLVTVFTIFAIWVIPGNLISYAKRKGLIYRGSDVQFLFTSPVSPKKILLYAHFRSLFTSLIVNILLIFAGIFLFKLSWWQMLLYFLFSVILENLMEGGFMLLLYGNERLRQRGKDFTVKAAYILIGIFAVMGIVTCVIRGPSMESINLFLHSDMAQMVPVIGWYIAVLHLLFLGPTVVNVVGTLLYIILTIVTLWAAMRMRCTGEFYEDAMKFAEDYEERLTNARQGKAEIQIGKKKKFGKASIVYKGGLAKAIFYRQLLEYKKSRFFIFDGNTVFSIIAGVVIAYLFTDPELGSIRDFLIPGAMAYVTLILTAYSGKWGKELRNPYTFLIPDTPWNKLWYATLIQHIQAVMNGCLFALPGAIVIGMSPATFVLCIAFYVTLNACKLYCLAVAEALVGNSLGNIGKQFVKMLLVMLSVGIPFIGAVLGMIFGGLNLAYVLMILLLSAEVAILMLIASTRFYRMETTA